MRTHTVFCPFHFFNFHCLFWAKTLNLCYFTHDIVKTFLRRVMLYMRRFLQKSYGFTGILASLFIFVSAISAEVIAVPSSGIALNKALAKATSGDTLELSAGTYHGRFTIPPGITLISDSLHEAKIKANGRDRALILTNNTRIIGLDVSGGKVGVYSAGIGNSIEKCAIHHNDQTGIVAIGFNVEIIDNIIFRNGGSGIQLWDVSDGDLAIKNNTIVHNNNHGISVGGDSHIKFINNIVAYNSKLTLHVEPQVKILQEYNVYYFNAEINMTLPENNYSFNPQFYAPSKNQYYVIEDSHCLKNGKNGETIGTRIYSHLYK